MKLALFNAITNRRTSIDYDGETYNIVNEEGNLVITKGEDAEPFGLLTTFVVRRYSGQDSLSFDFKLLVASIVEDMEAKGEKERTFVYKLPKLDNNGEYIKDENGEITPVDTDIKITLKSNNYVLTCEQVTFLIDTYSKPNKTHLFGTDGDGMDVLARMMYGGRISLLVGFVVVIIETILGVIMGGIAGYFGGWVDTVIMRLVDVFYCIPSMPILIILGALFDSLRMSPYVRLMWLMAILGILGWSGVARMVRGQILSLREQEFMMATEATGLKVSSRIFKHLVPNVMPQLIVTATAGLGGVILTESTLSFLGLGVKHPLATWGTMINSVSDYASMINYVYIWLPVGTLICATVIAFNFVGDGLRDAFDPKMKR
ncbi:MAG: ABC transporter permease [Eubacteriaceae bacterium]|nr:ABC transporter permease [Eubacteriaceae bacterium]